MGQIKQLVFTVTNDLTYDQRMQKICTSLAKHGYQVTLVGRKLPYSIPFASEYFHHKRIKCYFNKGKLFYIEYNLRLFIYLLFKSFDIISAVDFDTLVPAFLTGKLKGKPVVFDAHEHFTEVPEVTNRPVVKRVWEWVGQTFIPKTRKQYTVGPALAKILSQKYNGDFAVIRNAPYYRQDNFETNISEQKFVLYQGALNKSRGIEHMILATKLIPLEFHIIGEGDLSAALRELVKTNGLESKVKFLGFMQPEQLSAYSKKAYLGLNVSEHAGLSYYYSLNNKFFDYIHAGLPSLLNKFPEYILLNNEIETCILADPNPEDLADKINFLLNNPDKYSELKANCQKAAQRWNWQEEEKMLFKIYDEID
jgi:glycosyltransferase involved in cell wall biosynthesis